MNKFACLVLMLAASAILAQDNQAQLKAAVAAQQQKVDALQHELDAAFGQIERKIELMKQVAISIRDTKTSRGNALKIKKDTSDTLLDLVKFYKEQQALLKKQAGKEMNEEMRNLYEHQIAIIDSMVEKRVAEIIDITVSLNSYAGLSDSGEGDENMIAPATVSKAGREVQDVRNTLEKGIARLEKQRGDLQRQADQAQDAEQKAKLQGQVEELDKRLQTRKEQLLKTTDADAPGRAIARLEGHDLNRRMVKASREVKASYTALMAKKKLADAAKRELAVLVAQWEKATGQAYEAEAEEEPAAVE